MQPNSLPPHLAVESDHVDCSGDWCAEAQAGLIEWGHWWAVNQDRGTGLGYPTITPFERLNHPSGPDYDALPVMPFAVERIENALLLPKPLPWHLRLLAWRWYVSYQRHNLPGCARSVGLSLQMGKLSPTRFKQWRGELLAAVQGRI